MSDPLRQLADEGVRATQLRKRSSSPVSSTPASAAAASRSGSTRRKPVNAASDAESASRPWGTRGSMVFGYSSPACSASNHAR
jgi:hypothetical protein